MEKAQLEMVPCPVCGKPMPKKRLELGYSYCVNCSTERPKRCLIEGLPGEDGDDAVDATVHIVTAEEADEISRCKAKDSRPIRVEEESALDIQTFEEQDMAENLQKVEDQMILEEFVELTPESIQTERELEELLEDETLVPRLTDEEYVGTEEEFLEDD